MEICAVLDLVLTSVKFNRTRVCLLRIMGRRVR